MQIGKPLRTVIVEPLESPLRTAPDAEHDVPEPVAPRQEPEPEPVHKQVAP